MIRKLMIIAMVTALLTACDGLDPPIDEAVYSGLVGTWVVVTQPAGWVSSRFTFGADYSWISYWQHDTFYPDEVTGGTGTVVRCRTDEARIRLSSSLLADQDDGDIVVFTFVINSDGTMDAGWEGSPDQLVLAKQ